ncbi:MAG: CvpA family protein [Pseudomonadota bacterium]
MSWIDYCILFVFVASVLIGIWRGFTREILSLVTWIAAFVVAWLFSDVAASRLASHIGDATLRDAAGAALVFFAALFVGAVLTHFVVVAVRDSRFSPADRTLGGGLGLIRGAILVGLFVLVAGRMGADQRQWWRESAMIAGFTPLARGFESVIPERWLGMLKPALPPNTSAGQ